MADRGVGEQTLQIVAEQRDVRGEQLRGEAHAAHHEEPDLRAGPAQGTAVPSKKMPAFTMVAECR